MESNISEKTTEDPVPAVSSLEYHEKIERTSFTSRISGAKESCDYVGNHIGTR